MVANGGERVGGAGMSERSLDLPMRRQGYEGSIGSCDANFNFLGVFRKGVRCEPTGG